MAYKFEDLQKIKYKSLKKNLIKNTKIITKASLC